MKLLLVALMLISSSSFAGKCHYSLSSDEPLKLRFGNFSPFDFEAHSLEECVHMTESNLGKKVRAKTMVRNELRLVTGAAYTYEDERVSAKGDLFFKR